jgi:O-antigen/teichoic acid export membrane protein
MNSNPTQDGLTDGLPPLVGLDSANELAPLAARSNATTYASNVALSIFKIVVLGATGVFLPAYLTRHLAPTFYSGWILILQLANYITYLDLGLQTAVSKYIAQYSVTAGTTRERDEHATAGVAITCFTGLIGVLLTIGIAVSVARVFPEMPSSLARDVAWGTLLVGISTAAVLATSPFAAFFLGMQRYAIPSSIQVANRLAYVSILVVAVKRHDSLLVMGSAVAVVNLVTCAAYIVVWKLKLSIIQVSVARLSGKIVKKVIGYSAVLGVWTAGMLIITGLDTTVVGRYDFPATSFYAVAATPITFLSLILQATLGPLMPAISSLGVYRSPEFLGDLLARVTRYIFIILQLSGLPLIVFGKPVLTVWVGAFYASRCLGILRLLVLAYIIRNLCAPYATMVVALAKQKQATLSGVLEAIVNLASSVLLGRRFGAIGVAWGTVIGSVVGVLVHLVISIPQTIDAIRITSGQLLRKAVLRGAFVGLSALVMLFCPSDAIHLKTWMLPVIVWMVCAAVAAVWPSITSAERARFGGMMLAKLGMRKES